MKRSEKGFTQIQVAIVTLVVLLLPTLIFSIPPLDENLIQNPGFEEDNSGGVAAWQTTSNIEWGSTEVHTGNKAIKAWSQGSIEGVRSNFFSVPENSRVEVSAWMKAQDVISKKSARGLRLTLSAYEGDQLTRIRHWDLSSFEGTTDWKEFKGTIIAPPGTKYMKLAAQLTNASGVFWIDDVSVTIAQKVPKPDPSTLQKPVIIPEPLQLISEGKMVSLGKVLIFDTLSEERPRAALTAFLDEINAPYEVVTNDLQSHGCHAVIIIGDQSQSAIDAAFRNKFPTSQWSYLGEQGYFLSVSKDSCETKIYIGGNTEQARFYGVQTLKQLITRGGGCVITADILDHPLLDQRGVMLSVHWYSQRAEAYSRIAALKMNFVWHQGSFLNEKFRFRWREPLTLGEKANLKDYLEVAQKNFVMPYISISPKSNDGSNPPIYSSDSDINLVVSKMSDLYNLGYRNFGLSFDDLSNYGLDQLFGDDILFFNNDIGKAHTYFIEQIYTRLKAQHPDIQFMVVPMKYSSFVNSSNSSEDYLKEISRLPPEIGFFSAVEYPEEAEMLKAITNRRHMVMDNFWARSYREPVPEYVVPLDRGTEFSQDVISGYSFLALIPEIEDSALISWQTASDFAWNPQGYNPDDAFQRAAAQYLNRSHTISSFLDDVHCSFLPANPYR